MGRPFGSPSQHKPIAPRNSPTCARTAEGRQQPGQMRADRKVLGDILGAEVVAVCAMRVEDVAVEGRDRPRGDSCNEAPVRSLFFFLIQPATAAVPLLPRRAPLRL